MTSSMELMSLFCYYLFGQAVKKAKKRLTSSEIIFTEVVRLSRKIMYQVKILRRETASTFCSDARVYSELGTGEKLPHYYYKVFTDSVISVAVTGVL